MKGGRSLDSHKHSVQEKEGSWERQENPPGSPWVRGWWICPKEASHWSNLALASRAGWPWTPLHGGACSLGKLFPLQLQISAAPAIPCLSRNMKACYRWTGLWWPLWPGSGRREPLGRHRWSEGEAETMAAQLGSCWSSSACSPKSTRHCCPGSCP